MSEVQSRPARGRSTARGGRGGQSARGPRSSKQTNGDHAASSIDTSADQGELGELKKRYLSQLTTLKELFPDWADVDLVLALEESDGDMERTIEKISEGNVTQFAEVKKAKDRSRSKAAKETGAPSEGPPATRGAARARGGDSVRGRSRGADRGRGGFRGGARGGATNGTRAASGAPSVPTLESSAWDIPAVAEAKEEPSEPAPAPAVEAETSKPATVAASVKKTWASMFAATPKAAAPKPVAKPAAPKEDPVPEPSETPAHEVAQEPTVEAEELPIPPVADEVVEEPPVATEDISRVTPDNEESARPELTLTPSKDELTQDNVEHLPDVSQPPPTETAASTVASSKDIGSSIATPLSISGQAPIGRPAALGGFATSALKATSGANRSASFQRRLMEQQEAVVMPGKHAVNQAAVQFGSLGLNGDVDDGLDVDEDREEAETRTQPPQHSPVAQPRASLPPAPRQAAPAESSPQEMPTTKQAPGLPPPQQQNLSQQSPPTSMAAQAMQNQGSQNQPYNQFGRYGQGGIQPEAATPQQKSYDPFGQQAPQSQYDYPNQQQAQQQSQIGGFSSAPDAFASQYSTSEQQRLAYAHYYGGGAGYQQGTPSQQEAGSAQQRTGSGFGAGPNDSAFPQSQQQQQAHGRYNEAQNSGHNTPNPALGAQQPTGPSSQSQHMHQPHAQPGHSGNYPYNHPYYGSPYYANYMNQYGGYGQGGYSGFGGMGGNKYNQPHYGMSPQASFEQHSASPANAGGFGASSMHGRDAGLGGGLGDYGRSASGASQNQHSATAGSAGFGGLPDVFSGRSQGGYGGQNAYGQQASQQGGNEDSLKPFGDSKNGGPSPSALGAQPGRPGSATNNTASGQGQPQGSHQQGFGGGYPGGHLQGGQGSQYGGLGGLGHQGGHQGAGSHQQGSYGNYGGFGGGGYGNGGNGGYSRGGGWGQSYGQH